MQLKDIPASHKGFILMFMDFCERMRDALKVYNEMLQQILSNSLTRMLLGDLSQTSSSVMTAELLQRITLGTSRFLHKDGVPPFYCYHEN